MTSELDAFRAATAKDVQSLLAIIHKPDAEHDRLHAEYNAYIDRATTELAASRKEDANQLREL